MKKIIDGKRYDTETATSLGYREFGTFNDHHYVFEELFKTKKGSFFLHYAGGGRSKYAIDVGPNLVGGSSGTRPLSSTEALEWCENNDIKAEIIEQHFDIEEG